jgi:hypothetical protein
MMGAWAKVVSEPLGLAGFALFLIFTYLGKVKSGDKRRWISPVAFACAAATLLGGFGLAYIQIAKPVPPPASVIKPAGPTVPQINHVQQRSTGAGSPNVQGVNGDVTITVDQSNGETSPQQTAKKQP